MNAKKVGTFQLKSQLFGFSAKNVPFQSPYLILGFGPWFTKTLLDCGMYFCTLRRVKIFSATPYIKIYIFI
jgi:hypothetical protein